MKIRLDNSAFSTLSCRRKFQLTVIDGLHGCESAPLTTGNAYHKWIEHYMLTGDFQQALAHVAQSYPTFDLGKHAAGFKHLELTTKFPAPLILNGQPAIELKFSYPYGSFFSERDGEKVDVELQGTIDLVYLDGDTLVLRDYKTAADAKDASMQSKMMEYELSFQLPFYTYALLKSDILPEDIRNKILDHKYRTEYFYIFYNTAPPTTKVRMKGAFPDAFLHEEVPLIINQKVSDAIKVAQLKNTAAAHDGMCVYKACSYCNFQPACLAMGTQKEQDFLDRFERREYNPLTFR